LAASHLLTPAQVSALMAAINNSKIVPPGEAFSCPADDGSVDSITFLYPTGPNVHVIHDNTGCRFLHNGVIDAFTDNGVPGQLDKLFRISTPTR
jgi:hypothetical protein